MKEVKLSCYKRFVLLGTVFISDVEYKHLGLTHPLQYLSKARSQYPELDMIDIDNGRLLFVPLDDGIMCLISDPKEKMYNREHFVPYEKKEEAMDIEDYLQKDYPGKDNMDMDDFKEGIDGLRKHEEYFLSEKPIFQIRKPKK